MVGDDEEPKVRPPLRKVKGKVRRADAPLARRKREPPRTMNTKNSDQHASPAGDKLCGARKSDGGACTLRAGFGTDHLGYGPCKHHFGGTPKGRQGAAYDMAGELMFFYGKPIDTNPIDALLDEVRRTSGHVKWLGDRISAMGFELELDPTTGKPNPNTPIPPEIAGWINMYMSERGQLVRVCSAALAAGINERLVQISEAQGSQIADAIDRLLTQLQLTPEQQGRVPDLVPQILRGMIATPRVIEGSVG